MPDTATIQGCGLAMQRRLQVRVAKAPPPPERAPGGGSPVRLHPTALLPSIIESVTGTVAEVHSRTAVTAVRVLPTKPKDKGRLKATETREALAAGGALFASMSK